jgi:hypothetical protein
MRDRFAEQVTASASDRLYAPSAMFDRSKPLCKTQTLRVPTSRLKNH